MSLENLQSAFGAAISKNPGRWLLVEVPTFGDLIQALSIKC